MKRSKLLIAGIVSLIAGSASLLMQSLFYGYIDQEGILHDSLFMPLAFILFFIGVILLMAFVIRFVCAKFKA